MNKINIGIIGGGAAGFFAAIEIASLNPSFHVTILEKTEKIASYGYVIKNSGTAILAASIRTALQLHQAHRELKESKEKLEKEK